MSFQDPPGRTIIVGTGAPILVDAVLNESHISTTVYTDYTIESGGKVGDHVQEEFDRLEMEILLTDTPIGGIANPSFAGRHRALYSQLLIYEKLNSPLLVTTSLRSYAGIYIEGIDARKSNTETGKAVVLDIKFKKIDFTDTTLAQLTAELAVSADVAHASTGMVNLGLI